MMIQDIMIMIICVLACFVLIASVNRPEPLNVYAQVAMQHQIEEGVP